MAEDMLTPYSLLITSPEGQCLYKYEFVQFEHNEHLLTGVLTAIQMLHVELFGSPSINIALDSIQIASINVSKTVLFLLYQGSTQQAKSLLTEVLDIFCQRDILSNFAKNGLIYEIRMRDTEEIDSILFNHCNTEFLNENLVESSSLLRSNLSSGFVKR